MKTCTTCLRSLPSEKKYFSAHSAGKDGLQSMCKRCHADASRFAASLNVHRNRARNALSDDERWPPSVTKNCPRCADIYPRTPEFFHRAARSHDGLRSECKICHTGDVIAHTDPVKRAAYKKENAVRLGQYTRKWQSNHWAKNILTNSRTGTWRRGLAKVDVTEADILAIFDAQKGRCHWFGIPMLPTDAHRDPQRPSLDRLDNSRGYHRDNVVLCCAAANIGRSSASAERFAEFCATLKASMKDTST